MWLIFDVIRKPTDTSAVQKKSDYADTIHMIITTLIKIAFVIEALGGELFRAKARIRSHAGWSVVSRGV
jgi:hypothetical protein